MSIEMSAVQPGRPRVGSETGCTWRTRCRT